MALPGFLQTPFSANFSAGRNGIFRVGMQYALNGAGIDITGCGFRWQTRPSPGSGTLYTEIKSGSASANGGVITITDAVNGFFELYLANLDINSGTGGAATGIPVASPVAGDQTVQHDLVLYTPGFTSFAAPVTDFYRIATGTFTINEGVTR